MRWLIIGYTVASFGCGRIGYEGDVGPDACSLDDAGQVAPLRGLDICGLGPDGGVVCWTGQLESAEHLSN
jgi:hypothetical protein